MHITVAVKTNVHDTAKQFADLTPLKSGNGNKLESQVCVYTVLAEFDLLSKFAKIDAIAIHIAKLLQCSTDFKLF